VTRDGQWAVSARPFAHSAHGYTWGLPAPGQASNRNDAGTDRAGSDRACVSSTHPNVQCRRRQRQKSLSSACAPREVERRPSISPLLFVSDVFNLSDMSSCMPRLPNCWCEARRRGLHGTVEQGADSRRDLRTQSRLGASMRMRRRARPLSCDSSGRPRCMCTQMRVSSRAEGSIDQTNRS
jgi:hypothetical protein